MISFFNRIGNSWAAKAIFVALGISMMAFWGVGGIGNTAGKDATAIQVGSHKISMADLNKAFEAERARFSQLSGQYISPKKAIEMGLLEQTVQKQVTDTVNKMIQEDLGLAASDEAVRKYVERHPAFQNNLGQFDRNLFMAYLSQTRVSEAQLAEQLRNELANQHLSNTIRFAAPTSQVLAKLKWQAQNQQRDVQALLIETDKIKLNQQPTSDELKEYYEAYLSDFMIPEQRDITVLTLTTQTIADKIDITQTELDEAFELEKDRYATPEKRQLYQIRFNTKEAAEQAKDGLNAQNFLDKAAEYGQEPEQTDFGMVAKTDLLPEMGEAAFALNKNIVSNPVETAVGWHLILVAKIEAEQKPDKAKVYAQIKKQIATEKAYAVLEEKARQLEDLLGAGASLAQAAKEMGLETQTYDKVEMALDTLPNELKNQDLMQDLFTLKENEVSALTEHQNGYIVAEVNAIHPVQAKEFNLVQNQLKALWKQEQQKMKQPELVQKVLEQMKNGNISAKSGQVIVVKRASLKDPKDLPETALASIFTQAKGYENAQSIPVPNGMLIAAVTNIYTPQIEEKDLPAQTELVSAETAQSLYAAVVEGYAQNFNIQINAPEIQKAFSIYQTEE